MKIYLDKEYFLKIKQEYLRSVHKKIHNTCKNKSYHIDFQYLEKIDTDICPYLKVPLIFSNKPHKFQKAFNIINKNLGCIKGNVEFCSIRALEFNSCSSNELDALVKWLKNLDIKQNNIYDILKTYSLQEVKKYFDNKKKNAIKKGIAFDISYEYFYLYYQ